MACGRFLGHVNGKSSLGFIYKEDNAAFTSERSHAV